MLKRITSSNVLILGRTPSLKENGYIEHCRIKATNILCTVELVLVKYKKKMIVFSYMN